MHQNVLQQFWVVGVEDGEFSKGYGVSKTLFVSVLFVGTRFYDFQLDKITVDGLDATEKLSKMLHRWSFDAAILAGVPLQVLTWSIQRLFLKNLRNP